MFYNPETGTYQNTPYSEAYNTENSQSAILPQDRQPTSQAPVGESENTVPTSAQEQKAMLKKAKLPLWLVLGGLALVLFSRMKSDYRRVAR